MEISRPSGAELPILEVGRMGSWRKMTIKIFAQKFQLDGFFWWFLGLGTTHSCRETFVTNLFTGKSLLALTTSFNRFVGNINGSDHE